jgi:beta-lactamase regulating signal transducer with metallopeptidase domain
MRAMQMFVTSWNSVAQTWVERLSSVIWQSTLLTLVAALLVPLLLRRSSPSVRYWVWQILAIKLLVMPFWSWAVPWRIETDVIEQIATEQPAPAHDLERHDVKRRDAEREDSSDAPVATVTPEPSARPEISAPRTKAAPLPSSHMSWQSWLLLSWCGMLLAQVLRLLVQRRRLSRLLKQAAPADARLAEVVAETAERLGVRRVPQTLMTQSDCSPFVCGIWRPKLILPHGLPEKLTQAELGQVLLHEMAHIRRRDLIWSWIGEIARMAYFFHPAAHWICYQARLERELACDQLAMAVSGHGPQEYAATLVQVVSHASEPSVFKSAASVGIDGDRS